MPAELAGTLELGKGCFGPRGVRGKRGRGAGGRTVAFGLFKRGGIYTESWPVARKALQAVIRNKVAAAAMANTDGWGDYNGQVDVAFASHFCACHGQNELGRGASHISGIESFRRFA